MRLMFGRCCRE